MNGKSLNLVGAGASDTLIVNNTDWQKTIDGSSLNGGSVSVSGFTIQNGMSYFTGMTNCNFTNNIVIKGILFVIGSSEPTATINVSRCNFLKAPGWSMALYNSNVTVDSNIISEGVDIPIYLSACINPSITTNTITKCKSSGGAINAEGSIGEVLVRDNTITGNDVAYAIAIGSGYGTATIDHNTVVENTHAGILGLDGLLRITNNTITGNETGISLQGSSGGAQTYIAGNTISNQTGWGIVASSHSASTTVDHNTLTGNTGGGLYSYATHDLTVTYNSISGNGNLIAPWSGGICALSDFSGSLFVSNNDAISGNKSGNGGAIYAYGYASVAIENNTVESNEASASGGAFRLESNLTVLVRNNTIKGNANTANSFHSGGMYLVNNGYFEISANKVKGNTGRGIAIGNGAGAVIGNAISGNTMGLGSGGGAGLSAGGFGGVIKDNLVTNNNGFSAVEIGGPSTDIIFANNVIARNSGGVWFGGSAKHKIVNNTVVNNGLYGIVVSPDALPIVPHVVANNILWGNGDYDFLVPYWASATELVNSIYNDIGTTSDGLVRGEGCISTDPLILNIAGDDFHLTLSSPCIDRGSNSAVSIPGMEKDFYGQQRIYGSRVDIGASEGVDSLPPTTTCTLMLPPDSLGWNVNDVLVTLSSTDDSSGVKSVTYWASGAQTIGETIVPGSSNWFTITAEGITTITYYASDNSGNVEAEKTATVRIDRTGPVISAATNPTVLWPANGSTINVEVKGSIVDSGAGVDLTSATFTVTDEYGIVQPSGSITVNADGTYRFNVGLVASRLGSDKDGRVYTITIQARDKAGNVNWTTAIVTVPHDRRQ